MKTVIDKEWAILDKLKGNPFAGLLTCLYEIRFTVKRELTKEEKDSAFRCLNIIADDEKNDNGVRAFCYNELGLIHSGRSIFFSAS
jgi:hypothetical protein